MHTVNGSGKCVIMVITLSIKKDSIHADTIKDVVVHGSPDLFNQWPQAIQ